MDLELVSKAVVSMMVICSPFDAHKILFFNHAISNPVRSRQAAAVKVSLLIFVTLSGTALAGGQMLSLLGIDLMVFGAVGGLLIGKIGLEMMAGTGTGREEQKTETPEADDALLIPLTTPLIVGPGAAASVIALASQGEGLSGVYAASIGAAAVALAALVSYAWLGTALERMKPAMATALARLGGLVLTTIGAQMFLSNIKDFFSA